MKNEGQARKVFALMPGERRELPLTEIFPFFADFDDAIKADSWPWPRTKPPNPLCLENMTFTTELIGKGGFAEIYKAKGKDGTPYALKLFYPNYVHRQFNQSYERTRVEYVLNNIEHNFDFFSQEPFLKPLLVNRGNIINWYLLEFFDGRPVQKLLRQKTPDFSKEKDLAGKIMATYAGMLKNFIRKISFLLIIIGDLC
ncbi:MAG: hypothetical protein V1866_03220 [archaeon]